MKDNQHYCEYFDEIISHGLFSKITLATRICKTTSTLIDNIFTNNIDVPDSSGILLIRCLTIRWLVENLSYVRDVPKFIDIECTCNDPRSMQAFIAEFEDINIYDKLEQQLEVIQKKITIVLLLY